MLMIPMLGKQEEQLLISSVLALYTKCRADYGATHFTILKLLLTLRLVCLSSLHFSYYIRPNLSCIVFSMF